MQEVARGQPNGLAAFDNGADDVGSQEGIADCLAHAVRWDGVFGSNLLIGFACFDSVEPGEGVSDIAQECAVDGFRGVAQNELGLDTASTQAERCVDAECIFANAVGCAFYLFIRQPHGSEVSPAARNSLDSAPISTASKLLICGLFQKGRVLAQDGVIGEDTFINFGEYIRSFSDPLSARYPNPDHYRIRYLGDLDRGGVHINSSIVNHAFYLMVMGGTNRVSGISVNGIGFEQMDRMERIFYRAFMYYLVPSSNFSDAREATIRAARELYGAGVEEQTVRAGWNAVGVQ